MGILIKSLQNVKDFIADFSNYANDQHGEDLLPAFTFIDQTLTNSGSTSVIYDQKTDTYFQYSFGRGWNDKKLETIYDINKFIWWKRKSINGALKKNS